MTCGFLVLDKPSGMTSRRAVDRVKGLVRPEKTGHCGTLDPLATGVLVVAVGKATRLVPSVHDQRKTYRATFLLGRRSDSDDTETEVEVYEETPVLDAPTIEAALRDFIGPISQVPPAYSAVKVGGRRAYKLARAGQELDLKARTVEIDSIQLLDWDSPRLELEIVCSGGTYIRSLGRDLGQRLGSCGVMSGLVRTRVGPFTIEAAVPLESLDARTLAQRLVDPLEVVAEWPRRVATDAELTEISHGRRVSWPDSGLADRARAVLVDSEDRLAALGEYRTETGEFAPRQVFLDRRPGGAS
ncbi:MAG: tRNA pseudouridine(55) synthase TruB [Planctomycetaceae bacterium]